MKTQRSIELLVPLVFATLVQTVAQTLADSEVRLPTVLFEQNFERFLVQTELAESALVQIEEGSQQLVLQSGNVVWESDQVDLSEPLLTRVSLEATATPGAGGFHPHDHLRILAEVSDGQTALRPLADLPLAEATLDSEGRVRVDARLPLGALAERRRVNVTDDEGSFVYDYFEGIVHKPRWLKIVVESTIESEGTRVALDNLVVRQEPPQDGLEQISNRRGLNNYSVVDETTISPTTESHVIETTLGSLLTDTELGMLEQRLSSEALVLGTTSYFEVQKLYPVEFAGMTKTPNGSNVVQFRLIRPAEGWRSLTSAPALYFQRPGGRLEHVAPNRLPTIWLQPPWKIERAPERPPTWDEAAQGEFVYVPQIGLETESVTPVTGDAEFVDFILKTKASLPIDLELGDPGTFVVNVRVGRVLGEIARAEYRGMEETSDDGTVVRLNYRLARPPYGWPAEDMPFRIYTGRRYLRQEPSNGANNVIPVAEGRSEVRVLLPPTEEGEPQPVSVSDRIFQVHVDYQSDFVIDLETIGNGDVRLSGDPIQNGQLMGTEVFDNGRRVRATFQFERDPYAYRAALPPYHVSLQFPNGAVQDVEGNTTFGIADKYEFAPQLVDLEDSIDAAFLPLTALSPALEAYRFRVVYQSADSRLHAEDIEGNHLVIMPDPDARPDEFYTFREPAEEWLPVVTSVSRSENGGRLEVNYRWDQPASGWPPVARFMLLAGGIRDAEGGSVRYRDLATVGRSDLAAADVDIALIGGSVIEGDPLSHRLSFLVPYLGNAYSVASGDPSGPFSGATVWFGMNPGIMPMFEEGNAPPVLGVGSGIFRNLRYDSQVSYDAFFESVTDFESLTPEQLAELERLQALEKAENITVLRSPKTVVHIDVPRPPGGWDTWETQRVPYLFQAPGLDGVPSSIMTSGYIDLVGTSRTLPLLSSFADWVRRLEEAAELPGGSLEGDADGDGQDSLTEFALGSDPQNGTDFAVIEPAIIERDGQDHLQIEFTLRSDSIGLTAELQHSLDGKQWRAVEEAFELAQRTPVDDARVNIRLVSKEPMPERAACSLFRIAVAR